jgi:pimeloyl-ACP methyl ester carboxylesterase
MGTPLIEVKRLTEVWKNDFDWRKAEAKINVLPHYITDIDVEGFGSLNIHFLHSKSSIKTAIPLLFVHGWPGGFWEANKILPLLTTDGDGSAPSFDVVVPSLPGYGFSDGCKQKGFGLRQVEDTNFLRRGTSSTRS